MSTTPVGLTRQPRIFWFDAERQLSFGWSGRAVEPVTVLAHSNLSQHEFAPPAVLAQGSVSEALRLFEATCRNWRSPYLTRRG